MHVRLYRYAREDKYSYKLFWIILGVLTHVRSAPSQKPGTADPVVTRDVLPTEESSHTSQLLRGYATSGTQRPINKHKWERRIHTNCQRTRLGRIICVCRCLPIPPTSAWFNVRQGSFPSLRPWPCRFPHPPPPPPPLPQVVMCDMMSISFALDQQLS